MSQRHPRPFPAEFTFQVFSLLFAVLLIHTLYVTWVRPTADATLRAQMVAMENDPTFVAERSLAVIIRDYEQEACFVLMLWALAIMGYKAVATSRERHMLDLELVPLAEGMKILPEDTRTLARPIQSLSPAAQRRLLPRALLGALHRFRATRSIQDVSASVHGTCSSESERLDSELAMVRYIAWAIPSVGFIGTVRGIGEALAQAHRAVEGDIAGVTQSLGTAFNSTFIALLLSIILMFALHQLQLVQERLVLETESYCDDHLVQHLQVP